MSPRNVQMVGALTEPSAQPTAAQYALIRPFLREEVPLESLIVLPFALANDAVDRGDLRIPGRILSRLAETLVGKALLLHHDKDSLGEGLWYQASVRPSLPGEAGTLTLEAWAYVLKTDSNAELRQKIAAGIARYCSISFRWDTRLCSACGRDYMGDCPHYRGQKLPDGSRVYLEFAGDLSRYEAVEGSLVYLGQQRLAQLLSLSEGEGMDLEKLTQRLEALEARITAPAPAPASDGDALRADLSAQVERLAGVLERGTEAKAALAGVTGQPAAALIALRDEYQAAVDKAFPVAPSGNVIDPATSAAEQAEPKARSPRGVQF